MAAFPFEGDPDAAMAAMLNFLRTESGAEYIEVVDDYVHAIYVRNYLKLVEDVELLLDREAGVFQVRAFERTQSPASGITARVDELAQGWAFVLERQRRAAEAAASSETTDS